MPESLSSAMHSTCSGSPPREPELPAATAFCAFYPPLLSSPSFILPLLSLRPPLPVTLTPSEQQLYTDTQRQAAACWDALKARGVEVPA